MKRKTVLYILLASIILFVAVFLKIYLGENIKRLSNAVSRVDNELYRAKIEENKIKDFIAYKNKIGNNMRKAIRVEPVELDVRFSSSRLKEKLDRVINSTYLERGFFFLDNFRISHFSEGDESKGSKSKLEVYLKGKKILIFGFNR